MDENSKWQYILHYFLSTKGTNDKLFKVCRLTQIPNRRRSIDRRFQVLPIGDIIGTMGNLFVSEKLVDDISASVDSSMLKTAGPVWHKSDMNKNRLPISGIDTDAKWGFSKSKGWIFGYKLHMSCSTDNWLFYYLQMSQLQMFLMVKCMKH